MRIGCFPQQIKYNKIVGVLLFCEMPNLLLPEFYAIRCIALVLHFKLPYTQFGLTPLMEASRHGRKEAVEALIKTYKCSINAQDKVNNTKQLAAS